MRRNKPYDFTIIYINIKKKLVNMYIKQFHQYQLAHTVPCVNCNKLILNNTAQKPCDNLKDGVYSFTSLYRVNLKHFQAWQRYQAEMPK